MCPAQLAAPSASHQQHHTRRNETVHDRQQTAVGQQHNSQGQCHVQDTDLYPWSSSPPPLHVARPLAYLTVITCWRLSGHREQQCCRHLYAGVWIRQEAEYTATVRCHKCTTAARNRIKQSGAACRAQHLGIPHPALTWMLLSNAALPSGPPAAAALLLTTAGCLRGRTLASTAFNSTTGSSGNRLSRSAPASLEQHTRPAAFRCVAAVDTSGTSE